MRPIRLKIRGLNSFVEEQTIDFTELCKRGFFGIFGPTGSGKSTILDGMILALYGIKAMSRGTNEFINKNCQSAGVSYEFQVTGARAKRYRVEREFKLTTQGTKAGKCKLVDVTEEEVVLEDSVKGVDRACADIIGLTADDFMRTVVLPQGKFSEFLKVSGKDRREILERLFRLEEYGKGLEEKLNGALNEEKAKRMNIQGQMEAYVLASEELLEQRIRQQEEGRQLLEQTEKESHEAKEKYKDYQTVRLLMKEREEQEQKLSELTKQSEKIEQMKERRDAAVRADGIAPMLASYEELANQEKLLEAQIQEWMNRLDAVNAEKKDKEAAFQKIAGQRDEEENGIRLKLQSAKEAWEQWKELPEMIDKQQELQKRLSFQQKQLKSLEQKQELLVQGEKKESQNIQELDNSLQGLKISAVYREQIEHGIHQSESVYTSKVDLDNIKKKQKAGIKEFQIEETTAKKIDGALAEKEKERQQIAEQLTKLKADIREKQIVILRRELQEGTPCPVCGAIHHEPGKGIEQKAGILQGEENRGEANQLEENQVEELEEMLDKCNGEIQKLERKKESQTGILKLLSRNLNELQEEMKKAAGSWETQNALFLELQDQTGILDFKEEKKRLQKLEKDREEKEEQLQTARKSLSSSQDLLKEIQADMNTAKETANKIQLELAPLESSIQEKKRLVAEKIGDDRDPQKCIGLLEKELAFLLDHYEKCRQEFQQAAEESQVIKQQSDQLQGQLEGNKNARLKSEERLKQEMARLEFENIEEVKNAVLNKEQYQELKDSIENYYNEIRECSSKIKETGEKLSGRTVSEAETKELNARCQELETALNKQKEQLGEWKQQVKSIRGNLEKKKKLRGELDAVEHQISILEDLKGVSRGKRFVEYMAAERLKYISRSASRRLSEITNGSYELETNQEGEFVIRDNKNGGVLRAPATLSGGETFVTSLALALSLSEEIQLKGTAPLELFFLDEGFGSLDENLLDVVMTSLERIHNDHLKVGIISHVESVKARVPVRLIVSPAQSGIRGSKVEIEHL
ncbi:AAA family ATPase [uncultured Robinsoniella sp.]|uniref:AAA family ATPase n=1 Tax=uncultured Robinsoniella sp. TaxID=904190 RepID=UPI00374F4571